MDDVKMNKDDHQHTQKCNDHRNLTTLDLFGCITVKSQAGSKRSCPDSCMTSPHKIAKSINFNEEEDLSLDLELSLSTSNSPVQKKNVKDNKITEDSDAMKLIGCPRCYTYALVPSQNLECPKCRDSSVLFL
ncbi:hypothetical protein SUGI_0237460 [Cryptomeria japonica]|nr:hypothetical protein SUGI_0237460 [Cryptomeria japonica]